MNLSSWNLASRTVLVVALAGMLCAGFVAEAAPPATITIHGQLVDNGGFAITGARDYVVRFFDAATGNGQLGTDITGTANLSAEGLFNLSVTPPPEVLSSTAAWYEVAVDSDAVPNGIDANDLFPERTPVESVPFALQAAEALSAPTSSFSAITDLGEEGLLDNNDGNDLLTRQQADSRYAAAPGGLPSTAIVMSETNPNANLTGYTFIGSTVMDVVLPGGVDAWAATTTTGAPDSRAYHTAVWTGSEMVVWGGVFAIPLGSGGRYDPVADAWTATTATGAPSARYMHTAVWSGSEMIVWGGDDGAGTFLNTGGRYDPATNAWTAVTTTGAPTSRNRHTALWTGSEMIVWGGDLGNNVPVDTGARYDPAANTWTAMTTTDAPVSRYLHTVVWTGSEMIVWGGGDGVGVLNTGGRYDPATNTWTAMTTTGAPTARVYHTAVWNGSEMIVWGGSGGTDLNTGGRYDPVTNTWSATTTTGAPSARHFHAAAWTGSEMVVWSGRDGGGPFNTGGFYDPGADSWTATPTTGVPQARWSPTAVSTGSGTVFWGGTVGSGMFNSGGQLKQALGSKALHLFQKD